MSRFIFKMPDLGEGTVEAEIVAWHTRPGESVNEDQVIVEVMTDKAAVEVPAPVSGRVISISGEPGDKIAVGAPLIVFELAGAGAAAGATEVGAGATEAGAVMPVAAGEGANGGSATGAAMPAAAVMSVAASASGSDGSVPAAAVANGARAAPAWPNSVAGNDARAEGSGDRGSVATLRPARVMTSPANRRRAREAGIDLATLTGSGPGGRILSGDLAAATGRSAITGSVGDVSAGTSGRPAGDRAPDRGDAETAVGATTEIKVIGVRRLIAERMSEAKRNIPHFAYVEEVDVTELEALRLHLNGKLSKGEPGLTYLPLVVSALTRTLESFPQCNVLYDAARGVLVRHRAAHVGVATQTPDGLKVPVVRNAQSLSLWELAAAIRHVSERARTNKATREELVGSTITVTSLGKLGGIASTPVINAPEVAIIGLNKAVERPVVLGGAVVVRRIMNLSSSFDHRFVDGYDAAAMIQVLKEFLEHPATIFIHKAKTP